MDELFDESVRLQDELLGQIEPYGVRLGDYEFVGKEWIKHSISQQANPKEPSEYLTYKEQLSNRLKGLPEELIESWCLAAINIDLCIRMYKKEPASALNFLLTASREIGRTYGMASGVFWEASSSAQRAVLKKISTDPKQAAKATVRECWIDWQKRPDIYKGKAAFAKAMLDKFPDVLESQPVIERWCRAWERET